MAKAKKPVNLDFPPLQVTEVRVFPFRTDVNPPNRIKGIAMVILNNQLYIKSLRIMEGANGLYVGYPHDPFYKNEDVQSGMLSIAAPTTPELREIIETAVLDKYNDVTKDS